MQTAKLLAFLSLLIAPAIARAATCDAGSYLVGAECTKCNNPYYCPGDDQQYICLSPSDANCAYCDSVYNCVCEPDSTLYWTAPGATECDKCPEYTGDMTYFRRRFNSAETTLGVPQAVCRTEWYGVSEHGEFRFSCYYSPGGDYVKSGPKDGNKCMISLFRCDAGYAAADKGWMRYTQLQNELRIWVHTYDQAVFDHCQPAGIGYYAGADDRLPVACPAGTSTHTDTATSADDCEPLCGAGATEFHAGDLVFNMWPQGTCTTPALQIGIGEDVCCVNLAPGAATGAVNIQYEGKTYHTVN